MKNGPRESLSSCPCNMFSCDPRPNGDKKQRPPILNSQVFANVEIRKDKWVHKRFFFFYTVYTTFKHQGLVLRNKSNTI